MSMLETVARAIAAAGGSNLDDLPKSHGPGYPMRQMYESMARAAVEAMRLPEEAWVHPKLSSDIIDSFNHVLDVALSDA